MPQIINTNIASLNAQRNLNSAQNANDTALQRLSSGLRINSAADDAAGLSISTRFDAQINGSNQAIRNSADGVSLAQTAEGALDSITDSLQRIRELAVQSANGTNNSIDREALNLEAQQLIDEIENVSETANFNGTSLLDGSFNGIRFQTGANADNSIDVTINEISTNTLGVAKTAGLSAFGGATNETTDTAGTVLSTTQVDTSANALSNGDLVINGVAIQASSGGDDSASFRLQDASAIAKAAAINEKSDETGVTAVALETEVAGQAATYLDTAGSFELNGVSIDVATNSANSNDANRETIVAAINAVSGQTGVVATNTGNDSTGITLTAEDGRNITLSDFNGFAGASNLALGGNAAGSDGAATTVVSTVSAGILLQSNDGSDIVIGEGTGDLANSGFTEGAKSGQAAQISSAQLSGSAGAAFTTIDAGDLTINGISIRATTENDDTVSYANGASTLQHVQSSAISRATAINEVSDNTGVTAIVEATRSSGSQTATALSTATAAFTINGVSTSNIDLSNADASTRRQDTVDAINAISGQTGVTAVDSGDGIELVAEDGRNITIQQGAASALNRC